MNFPDELTDIPADRVSSGFVEIGEFRTDEYEFESDVNLKMAPDGSIWAKICNSAEELPSSPECKAWNILAEAEEAFGAKSMAEDRAACSGWPPPTTVNDYMMWIKDEIKVQHDQLKDHPEEADRKPYLDALRGVYRELDLLGFYTTRK